MGGVMVSLVVLYALCHWFVDYQGHMMGARMERDMRNELFAHLQKLSYKFYDEHKNMARLEQSCAVLVFAKIYHKKNWLNEAEFLKRISPESRMESALLEKQWLRSWLSL